MNLGTYVGKQLKHDWGKRIGVSRSRLLPSTEMITNGGFDNGTGWTLSDNVDIADGVCHFTDSQNADCVYRTILTNGKKYEITFTVLNYIEGSVRLEFSGGSNGVSGYYSANGTYRVVCIAHNTALYVASYGANTTLDIDNISLREVLNPMYGPELVRNGGFDTDDYWTISGPSILQGKLHFTSENQFTYASLPNFAIANHTYRTEYTVSNFTGGIPVISIGNATGVERDSNGTFIEYLIPTTVTDAFYMAAKGINSINTFDIDNISVREVS